MSTSSRFRLAVSLIALATALGLATTACATFTGPAWRVGDVSMSVDDFYQAYLDSLGTTASTTTEARVPTADLAQFMTGQIKLELANQLLAQENLQVTDDDRSRAEAALSQRSQGLSNPSKEDVEIQAAYAVLGDRLVRDAIDSGQFTDIEDQARQLFDQSKAQLNGVVCFHVMEIDAESTSATPTQEELDAAKAKADQAVARLQTEDFADVAADVSSIPASTAPGGDLGCRTIDQVPSDITDELSSLPKGKVSDPVAFPTGYLVLRVDRRVSDTEPPVFEEWKDDVTAVVIQNKATELASERLATISEGKVSVDPRFGTWDAGGLVVNPPEGAATPTVPTTAQAGFDPTQLGQLGIDPSASTSG